MNHNDFFVNEHFTRCIDHAFTIEEFKDLLNSGQKLRIKYGVDVTAPHLHLGHAVNLWMMRYLQDLGHKVIFLIGDFTTQIGDPTGKNKTRPIIGSQEIDVNANKFLEQVKSVLRTDEEVFEVRRNSEWFNQMHVAEFLKLLSMTSHGRLILRDMFQQRIANNESIAMHEMLYPVLQGYDSVMLQSNLTIVGTDQLFNENMGRFYQERFMQKPQVILTSRITMGTDGKFKQSKSLGNYIALTDSPNDKFGKVMSIPDHLIADYLDVYTHISNEEILILKEKINTEPMQVKLELAKSMVAVYHGLEIAQQEKQNFIDIFSRGKTPDDMPVIKLKADSTVFNMLKLCEPTESNAGFRRLLKQGAIKLNEQKVEDLNAQVVLAETENILKIGKRRWFKIVVE